MKKIIHNNTEVFTVIDLSVHVDENGGQRMIKSGQKMKHVWAFLRQMVMRLCYSS